MEPKFARTSAVFAFFVSAGLAAAQTTTTPTYETNVTTGIVGFAPAAQTAQLNVLNIGGIFAATSNVVAACPVELEFYDAQNNILKSLQITNVSQGTAASLTLKLADLPAAEAAVPRTGIRGVVRSNLSSGVTTIPSGTGAAAIFPFCSFVTTLELFDSTTGVTQTFTSDTHSLVTAVAIPLASSTH